MSDFERATRIERQRVIQILRDEIKGAQWGAEDSPDIVDEAAKLRFQARVDALSLALRRIDVREPAPPKEGYSAGNLTEASLGIFPILRPD